MADNEEEHEVVLTNKDLGKAVKCTGLMIQIFAPFAAVGDKNAMKICKDAAMAAFRMSAYLPEDDPNRQKIEEYANNILQMRME